MELIKLTPANARNYIGYEILFKTRNSYIVKRIKGVTATSVWIDHPDLGNYIQIVTRDVYVIIN